MAVSVVSFTPPGSWTGTADISLAGLSWSAGDVIVVVGGVETASLGQPSTPTNANLTFTLRASNTGGGANECSSYIWSATAADSQSSQTVSVVRATETGHWGAAAWVLTGASGSVANASANITESGFTFTPTAGSAVCYFAADWNATSGKTLATGSGTGTERVDANSTQWGHYAGEWVDVTAGSTTFGITSYAGMTVSHVALEVLSSAVAEPSAGGFRRRGPGHRRGPSMRMDLLRAHHQRRRVTEIIVGVAETNAPAEVAAAAGVADNPAASVAPNAGTGTATGVAFDATVTTFTGTNAPAGHAVGTGTAFNPAIVVVPNAGTAAGSGVANSPTANVRPNAGTATGTGTANNAAPTVQANAGTATGTGTANSPAASIKVNAGIAIGTGTAFDPTVITGALTNAPAGHASATGTANNATIKINPNAGHAASTGTANAPTVKVSPNAGTATGSGIAFNPTVAISKQVFAGVATATGTANSATSSVRVNAGTAVALGTALTPTIPVAVTAGVMHPVTLAVSSMTSGGDRAAKIIPATKNVPTMTGG